VSPKALLEHEAGIVSKKHKMIKVSTAFLLRLEIGSVCEFVLVSDGTTLTSLLIIFWFSFALLFPRFRVAEEKRGKILLLLP